jgi:hypothetical protein
MSDYEIVIHLRESAEPTRIDLPDVTGEAAEADRKGLIYEIEQARHAEVPVLSLQTKSGYPEEPLSIDPHQVTEIDLIERPADDE